MERAWMIEHNPLVDAYLQEGCGRCKYGGTPQCKVHTWPEELSYLREIVLSCGLTEERKWSVPCYTHHGKNIAIVAAFKEYCALSFFKGALLQDTHKLLDKSGENSQSARYFKFTDVSSIKELEPVIKSYIFEAIAVEKANLKVAFKKDLEPMPEELIAKLAEFPALKTAFETLTPGRQRGYIIFFSQPKNAATRCARIEKNLHKIMAGKGLYD